MRIEVQRVVEEGGTWQVYDVDGIDSLLWLCHLKIRQLKPALPKASNITILFCDVALREHVEDIRHSFGAYPVYITTLNEDVSLMPSVLAEIERALQSYDVTAFTDDIIQSLRDYVESNEYVFSSRLMSEMNRPGSIRAILKVQIHADDTELILELFDVRQKRKLIQRETVIRLRPYEFVTSFPASYRLSRQLYRLHWESLYTVDVIGMFGDRFRYRIYPKQDGHWVFHAAQLEHRRSER
ncbi:MULTISPECIES: hypothetical protein [Exiguobacterium]|uniref:hypothetical protein n=1 Tax=Exiguobacterium TaxID=33986 RepID=UPI001BE8A07C|nr:MULTISPECIES: hypothetical protein [Exiguobacterium]MCT4790285.1 hypothetical protein [Exiguobacterium mexicanum]